MYLVDKVINHDQKPPIRRTCGQSITCKYHSYKAMYLLFDIHLKHISMVRETSV